MKKLYKKYLQFEKWFNSNFEWFFTNGRKNDIVYQKRLVESMEDKYFGSYF